MPSSARGLKIALGVFKPPSSISTNNNSEKERKISKEIERRLSSMMKSYNQTVKILLLGAGESGKTTIIKQMKILHFQGFTLNERLEKIKEIHYNLLESIDLIVRQMIIYGTPLQNKSSIESFEYIKNLNGDFENFTYSHEFFKHVKQLWNDPGVKDCFTRGSEYQLHDCAKYFLDRVLYLSDPSFIPTNEDILHSRKTTTDIQKIEFEMKIPKKYGGGIQNFCMYDVGGQKGERRKWIQVFDGIETILFLVASNAYDQFLADEPSLNKLQESINLFTDVWNSRFLQDSGFIVFLNKQDLLKAKIKNGKSPISHYFPQYFHYKAINENNNKEVLSPDDEYLKTRAFIRDLFIEAKESQSQVNLRKKSGSSTNRFQKSHQIDTDKIELKRECYWHYTTATDTNNIERVFEDVHHMIINNHLETLGLT